MAPDLPEKEFKSRAAWRRWLDKNHASSPGIWMVFPKKHTGRNRVPYADTVEEALCFGWIDSLVRTIDDDLYAQKFTPRNPKSLWSEINRKRYAQLKKAGLLAPAGVRMAPTKKRYDPPPEIPELPDYIAEAFRKSRKAWKHFNELAPAYRRNYVAWIHTARRPETREKRILESVRLLERGDKLGMK